MIDWKSIETAPNDGKWVLVWWPYVVKRPMVAYRLGKIWHAAPSSDNWGDNPPTHWAPLPEAPK